MNSIFTPRLSYATENRAHMELNLADIAKIKRGVRWSATVTDQKTGERYRAKGASCGLPRCFCDAVITSVL